MPLDYTCAPVQKGPLDKNGIKRGGLYSYSEIMDAALDKRSRQWESWDNLATRRRMLSYQRKHHPRLAVSLCRTTAIENPHAVTNSRLWLSPSGYSWTGYKTCDSPWCLICSRKRGFQRAQRIEAGLKAARLDKDMKAFFVTTTIPRSGDIAQQVSDNASGWKKINQVLKDKIRKRMRRDSEWNYQPVPYTGKAEHRKWYKKPISYDGPKIDFWMARAMDITFKPSSNDCYHLHSHAIIMTNANLEADEMDNLIKSAWIDSNPEAMEQCQKVEEVRSDGIGQYVAKLAGLGMELTNGINKRGRGGLSLAQLIQAGMQGEYDSNGVFQQSEFAHRYVNSVYVDFMNALKGKRSLEFTRNWKWLPEQEDIDESKRPEEIALVVPWWWYNSVSKRLDDIGEAVWKDRTMGKGLYVDDLVNMVEHTDMKEATSWNRDQLLNEWLNMVNAQIYDQVASVNRWEVYLYLQRKRKQVGMKPVFKPPK